MRLAKMICSKRDGNEQKGNKWGVVGSRAGQSMTSLLIGLAVMGAVGAGAAKLSYATSAQEKALSAKGEAAALVDAIADEIRTGTRYSDLEEKYGGADGKVFSGDGEFEVWTHVRKVCDGGDSAPCNVTYVDIEVVDKSTDAVALKQTVTRMSSRYEEAHSFTSANTTTTFAVPEDAVGMRYVSEGGGGNSGGNSTSYGYALRYHSGSCSTGYKVNSAGTGCTKITCPSGQVLNGDTCEDDLTCVEQAFFAQSGRSNDNAQSLRNKPISQTCVLVMMATNSLNNYYIEFPSKYIVNKSMCINSGNGSRAIGINEGIQMVGPLTIKSIDTANGTYNDGQRFHMYTTTFTQNNGKLCYKRSGGSSGSSICPSGQVLEGGVCKEKTWTCVTPQQHGGGHINDYSDNGTKCVIISTAYSYRYIALPFSAVANSGLVCANRTTDFSSRAILRGPLRFGQKIVGTEQFTMGNELKNGETREVTTSSLVGNLTYAVCY